MKSKIAEIVEKFQYEWLSDKYGFHQQDHRRFINNVIHATRKACKEENEKLVKEAWDMGYARGQSNTLKEVINNLCCVSHLNNSHDRKDCAICKYTKQLEAKIKEMGK